jgi:hypothetical protein
MENRPDPVSHRSRPPKKEPWRCGRGDKNKLLAASVKVRVRAGDEAFLCRRQG